MRISHRLGDMYSDNAGLNTYVSNVQNQEKIYVYNPQELDKNLRGNKRFENLLQEKRVVDAFVIQQTKGALKRLKKIIETLNNQH
jgi:polyhydroxyalkanoate synthesis regulator phasin